MLHHAFLAVLAEIPALVRDEISLRCSDTDTPQALLTCTDTNPAGLQAISAGGTQHTWFADISCAAQSSKCTVKAFTENGKTQVARS